MGKLHSRDRSIRLNTDLAKKPAECLEYIVVHEMAHLIVRRHDERFVSLVGQSLPNWKLLRQTLNGSPLSHQDGCIERGGQTQTENSDLTNCSTPDELT
jgi:predicted metal-dependent hydrolase